MDNIKELLRIREEKKKKRNETAVLRKAKRVHRRVLKPKKGS